MGEGALWRVEILFFFFFSFFHLQVGMFVAINFRVNRPLEVKYIYQKNIILTYNTKG